MLTDLEQILDADVTLSVQVYAHPCDGNTFCAELLQLQADDFPKELACAEGATISEALKNLQVPETLKNWLASISK